MKSSLHVFLDLVAALPEVHLLPHHCAPHAEETPQVVEGAAVEGVFVSAAVLEVGDAVARHELPGGGVERNQVEVGAEQEQHDQREQSHQHGHSQQHAVGAQPQLPGGRVAETRPEETRRKEVSQWRFCSSCGRNLPAVVIGDSVVLTRQCAAPTAAPPAGRSGKAQTSGGSSHRHSSQSRGSDGRNAGHSADTSGSALISLAAAWNKDHRLYRKHNFKYYSHAMWTDSIKLNPVVLALLHSQACCGHTSAKLTLTSGVNQIAVAHQPGKTSSNEISEP